MAEKVDKSTQKWTLFSANEVNTLATKYENRGMEHIEGGWPKDIDRNDIEQVTRFRQKTEKDERYLSSVPRLARELYSLVQQNDAIDIYETYFRKKNTAGTVTNAITASSIAGAMVPIAPETDFIIEGSMGIDKLTLFRIVAVYKLPNWQTAQQQSCLSCVSLAPNDRIAVCAYNDPNSISSNQSAFVWNFNNVIAPEHVLNAPASLSVLKYHPKDPNLLTAGLCNGLVSIFDLRADQKPQDSCQFDEKHRDVVSDLVWSSWKNSNEFCSVSTDSFCKWWDARKLAAPVEKLLLQFQGGEVEFPFSGSSIENDAMFASSGSASKFTIGTVNGSLLIGQSRKTKDTGQTSGAAAANHKLTNRIRAAHHGPIERIDRNPQMSKLLLTIGDWSWKLWSEECPDTAILWSPSRNQLHTYADACWSPTRISIFFVADTAGFLHCWDLLQNQTEPIARTQISDSPLCSICVHSTSQFLILSDSQACTYLVQLNSFLVMSRDRNNERSMFTQMIDNEIRREKVLQSRMREIRLKNAAATAATTAPLVATTSKSNISSSTIDSVETNVDNFDLFAPPAMPLDQLRAQFEELIVGSEQMAQLYEKYNKDGDSQGSGDRNTDDDSQNDSDSDSDDLKEYLQRSSRAPAV